MAIPKKMNSLKKRSRKITISFENGGESGVAVDSNHYKLIIL